MFTTQCSPPKKSIRTKLTVSILLITLLASFMPQLVFAYPDDYYPASPEITSGQTAENVISVAGLADALYQDNQKDDYTAGQFTWDTEGKERSWTYYNGIMMDAFLMIGPNSYLDYVNSFYDANINSDGWVNDSTSPDNYYRTKELDSIPPTRAVFDLLRDTSGTVTLDQKRKYSVMIFNVYTLMQGFSKIEEAGNNFYHKVDNSNWSTYQVALDGLYMAQPFFMEVANALDDGILSADYFSSTPDSAQIYEEVYTRMLWIGENLYDEDTGLYNHGWGKDGVSVNGQFWLRAVGWYAAALADVISMFPEEYYSYRQNLIAIEKRLFDGMMPYQDSVTGMWYNVINYDSGLATASNSNQLETSGTALMAYAILKSYVEGYVDDTYVEAGLRAFNGICLNLFDGRGLHNVYKSSGVTTTPEGYLTSTYQTNEAKGVGPFIMAATYAEIAAAYHENPLTATLSWTENNVTVPVNTTPDFSGVTLLLEFENETSLNLGSDKLTFADYDSSVTGTQYVGVYYNNNYYGSLEVTFVEPETEPTFAKRSLSLGGEIGVNFFMDLPGDIADYSDSYMTFTYNGKEDTAYFNEEFKNSTDEYYGFKCLVNSLQMAEEITAVFHYGENNSQTVQSTYSVLEYLNTVKENGDDFEADVLNLINAIGDYGYYAQIFSAQQYNYTISDRYTPMPSPTVSEFDYATIVDNISDYALVPLSGGSGIEKLTYALVLDSRTDIRIYLQMKEDCTVEPVVTINDETGSAELQNDGRYMVSITDIPAHKLTDMYDVGFSADGEDSIKVSAMSYISYMLRTEDSSQEIKDAMAAFYNYSKAATAYAQS